MRTRIGLKESRIYFVYTIATEGGIMETNENQGGIYMTTKVQKWGNSLAVRIPHHIAERLAIYQGSELEISVENDKLMLVPKKKKPTLEELLARVTPENRHAEIDFGTEGNESL